MQGLFWCIKYVHIKVTKYGMHGYQRGSQTRAWRRRCASPPTKVGCRNVFRETASGAKTDRSQLRMALGQLEATARLSDKRR